MDLHFKQEVKVGVLVITAVTLFVAGLMWLSGVPFIGGRQVSVPVTFANVSGLNPGDPVLVSGLQIGRVAEVHLEDVGRVMVTLRLETGEWRPRIDARAAVRSLDFLGSKFIDYVPGNSQEFLTEGQVVTGSREVDAMTAAGDLADQAASVLTGLQSFLAPNVLGEVQTTMISMQRALDKFTELGGGPIIGDATEAMHNLRSSTERVDSLLANPALERSVNQLDEVTTSLQEMAEGLAGATVALSAVFERINRGEGTVGLALSDSTLYNNANDVLVSLRELLDDIRERPGRYLNITVF